MDLFRAIIRISYTCQTSPNLACKCYPAEPGEHQQTCRVHLRSAGHSHDDMVFQPIEKVRSKDRFVLEARERFWIKRYQAVETQAVGVVEHGINFKIK